MTTNRIFIYEGEQGLHCQCGNSEPTPEQGSYKTFSAWWDTTKSPSGTMAACNKCGSEAHRVQVISRSIQAAK